VSEKNLLPKRTTIKSKSILMALLFSIGILSVTANLVMARDEAPEKQKVLAETSRQFIEVGKEQLRRNYHKAAEQSFIRARQYERYLSEAERQNLKELLETTLTAQNERDKVQADITTAGELIAKKQFLKAKAHLEKASDSQVLTKFEREQLEAYIQELDTQINVEQKRMTELYEESIRLYQQGELQKAQEGFMQVARSGIQIAPTELPVEDYLAKIKFEAALGKAPEKQLTSEKISKPTAEPPKVEPDLAAEDQLLDEMSEKEVKAEIQEPATEPQEPSVAAPEATEVKGGYIDLVLRKKRIQQSYTRVFVDDAIDKANKFIKNENFSKAKEAVNNALRHVNKNRLLLGDELFKQYHNSLTQLTTEIIQKELNFEQEKEKKRLQKAQELQESLRAQQLADRKQKVKNLMRNAKSFQKELRYEEALGQIEMLLAIDPLNNDALLKKLLLKDVISLREQLKVQKETDEQELKVLLETDKAAIPYADEIVFPRNWRELTKKREAQEMVGIRPADAIVYKQLLEVVDLSALTPDMTFGEAIDVIRNSVEPPLKLFPNWKDLEENAYIDQGTPIDMQGEVGMPLGKALELLLDLVSGGLTEIDYLVEDGIITIATQESLPGKTVIRIYDITDLLGVPANFVFDTVIEEDSFVTSADSDELLSEEEAIERAEIIVELIQQTVEPDSWFEAGGEGSISIYGTRLVVTQVPEIQEKVTNLIKDLRKSLGQQVAIEARFLVVDENFLEDIGFDADLNFKTFGGDLTIQGFGYGYNFTQPRPTRVPGSIPPTETGVMDIPILPAFQGAGHIKFLDNLQVDFILRATQAHKNATALTAPKVTVLDGESAALRVQRETQYIQNVDVEVDSETDATTGLTTVTEVTVDRDIEVLVTGVVLNVTPTISVDKKYVLLRISTFTRELQQFATYDAVQVIAGQEFTAPFFLPETEIAEIRTRVMVPDGGTVLLGGQKLSAEVEKESGIPVISKIPILGRFFTNRSKVKDQRILLILVTPTIILQDEAEAEAIAAME